MQNESLIHIVMYRIVNFVELLIQAGMLLIRKKKIIY
jgi:hypothetical protein